MADTPGSGDGTHAEGDKKPETVPPAESPKPERVNLTLRSLMPSPINHAARRNKAEARLRKMIAKNEAESVSDEEKSYLKSIRERTVLADHERREANAYRARYEQQRVNNLFFSNSRKSQEESADSVRYRALIATDLWMPSVEFRKPNGVPMERISVEAISAPSLTEYPAYKSPMGRSTHNLTKLGLPARNPETEGVAIPDCRAIGDYASGWDESVTSSFQTNFKAGYITSKEPEPSSSGPSHSSLASSGFASPITSPTPKRTARGPKGSAASTPRTPGSTGTSNGPFSPASTPASGRGRGNSTPGRASSSTPSRGAVTTNRTLGGAEESESSEAVVVASRTVRTSRVWQYFHPTRWTASELNFVQALVHVLGPGDWNLISHYMNGTKSPAILGRTWLRYDGDFSKVDSASFDALKCDACKENARLAELVFCESCYRAYHLHCTYPVLERVPDTEWFCSTTCTKLGTLNCKTCGKASDDHLILICDKCERGAHMYCLAVPLKEIPEGDWFCDECSRGSDTHGSLPSKHGSLNPKEASRITSRAQTMLLASQECHHEHGLSKHRISSHGSLSARSDHSHQNEKPSPSPQPNTSSNSLSKSAASPSSDLGASTPSSTPSLGNGKQSPHNSKPKFLDLKFSMPSPVSPLSYLLLSNAIEVSWKDLVSLANVCVDCLIEQDGGVIPSKMGDFVAGHVLLPTAFQDSIFAHQLDDVPFTSTGDTPDPAALNAHFDTLLEAVDAYVDRALFKPLLAKMAPPGYVPQAPVASPTSTGRPKTGGRPRNSGDGRIRRPKTSTRGQDGSDALHTPMNLRGRTGPGTSPQEESDFSGVPLEFSEDPFGGHLDPTTLASGGNRSSKNTVNSASIGEWLAEGGYSAEEQCYWIFQANPALYDITTSLKHLKHMTWVIRQNQSRIRKGDRVFVWESGKDSGIVALGTVVSDPSVIKENAAMRTYAKDPSKFDRPDLRCHLNIEHVLPSKFRRSEIASDPSLTNLTILRAPIGTNFKVTKNESIVLMARLHQLHPSNAFKPTKSVAKRTSKANNDTKPLSEPSIKTSQLKSPEAAPSAPVTPFKPAIVVKRAGAIQVPPKTTPEVEAHLGLPLDIPTSPVSPPSDIKSSSSSMEVDTPLTTSAGHSSAQSTASSKARSSAMDTDSPTHSTSPTSKKAMDVLSNENGAAATSLAKTAYSLRSGPSRASTASSANTTAEMSSVDSELSPHRLESELETETGTSLSLAPSSGPSQRDDASCAQKDTCADTKLPKIQKMESNSESTLEASMETDTHVKDSTTKSEGKMLVDDGYELDDGLMDSEKEESSDSDDDENSMDVDTQHKSEGSVAPNGTGGFVSVSRNRQILNNNPDPSLIVKFPLDMVKTCVVNSRRMRLALHQGSPIILAVSGGRHMKKKMSGKVPLVPVVHISPVQTFLAKTFYGWKFKLRAIAHPDAGPITCPTCTFPVGKSATVACITCGKPHHAQCAARNGAKLPNSLLSFASPPHAGLSGNSTQSSSNPHSMEFSTPSTTRLPPAAAAFAAAGQDANSSNQTSSFIEWTCPTCISADTPTCSKCRRVARAEFINCDSCDEPYHISCISMKSPPEPGTHWLCIKCNVTSDALVRIKLNMVLRELRLEVVRLILTSLDIAASRLRKCIEAPDKSGLPLPTLAVLSNAIKLSSASITCQATERWHLYRKLAQVEHCPRPPHSLSTSTSAPTAPNTAP